MACRFLLAIAFALCALAAGASPLGPDGAPGTRLPGKFIWFDLATEDPAVARAFYGAVLGWKFREVKGAAVPYTLIEGAGGKVGGLFRRDRPAGAKVGSRWLVLMAVGDPGKTSEEVRARGGEGVVKPTRIPGRGMHAVFRDPDGALFGVLANEGGDPADTAVAEGDMFWVDLFTHDAGKAASFYAALGGHDVHVGDVAGRSRTLLATNGIARAGIARLPASIERAAWLPYVLVDDVPATLARVRAAGGTIIMAPRPDLLGGNVAVIADPQGGAIGIVNWVASESAR